MKDIRVTRAVASFAFLPISYAKAAAYYKAEGLNVTQIKTRGGGPDLVALPSGDVQFNAGAGTYQIGAVARLLLRLALAQSEAVALAPFFSSSSASR